MPVWHEGGVDTRECPHCGQSRPYDWYVPASDACWRCRERDRSLRENLKREGRDKGAIGRAADALARRKGERGRDGRRPPTVKERACELHAQGLSVGEIAEEMGCARAFVRDMVGLGWADEGADAA